MPMFLDRVCLFIANEYVINLHRIADMQNFEVWDRIGYQKDSMKKIWGKCSISHARASETAI